MKKIAYILIGPSGAGKTTTIEQLKREHEGQDVGVFSLDTCRLAYYGFYGEENQVMAGRPKLRYMQLNLPSDKEEASKFYSEAFDFCNNHGKDFDAFVTESWLDVRDNSDIVIVDNTNISKKARTRWVNDLRKAKTAGQFGFHIVMIEFHLPIGVIQDRQSLRQDKTIPIAAANQQYFRQEAAQVGSECDELRVVVTFAESGDSQMRGALISHNRYVQSQADKHAAKATLREVPVLSESKKKLFAGIETSINSHAK